MSTDDVCWSAQQRVPWQSCNARLTVACTGPTKLFVMVRAPEQLNVPPGFLPKRTFQMRQRRGLQAGAIGPYKISDMPC